MEEAQCDGVSLIKFVFSPEPLTCLLVFKFSNFKVFLLPFQVPSMSQEGKD